MGIFSNRNANSERPWRDVEKLIEALTQLADKRFSGSREFTMWSDPRETRIVIKAGGSEYQGKGCDPWEAAADLAAKASSIAGSIGEILKPEST